MQIETTNLWTKPWNHYGNDEGNITYGHNVSIDEVDDLGRGGPASRPNTLDISSLGDERVVYE